MLMMCACVQGGSAITDKVLQHILNSASREAPNPNPNPNWSTCNSSADGPSSDDGLDFIKSEINETNNVNIPPADCALTYLDGVCGGCADDWLDAFVNIMPGLDRNP